MRSARNVLPALICVSLLSGLAGGQTQTSSAQKLYGSWYPYPAENPSTLGLRHQFRHNDATGADEMVLTRVCVSGGKQITAKAVVPIEVTEDTIRVLKNASDVQRGQSNDTCEVAMPAGMLDYSFSEEDGRLTITNPGGNPDIVELERHERPTEATPAQAIYGSWLEPVIKSKDLQMQTRYVFYSTADHHDKVREIAVCSKGSDSTVSHVDSEITVSKDRIVVLESDAHEQRDGAFMCRVAIAAGTWHYALGTNGQTMTLSTAGKPITLTREPNSGLN